MNKTTERGVAFHEAGHWVTAWWFRLGLREVNISYDQSRKDWAGETHIDPDEGTPESLGDAWPYLIHYYVGMHAEALETGIVDRVGARDDIHDARERAGKALVMQPDAPNVDTLLDRVEGEAMKFAKTAAPLIRDLVEELLAAGSISGLDAAVLIEKHAAVHGLTRPDK